jgi:hypothetical protein
VGNEASREEELFHDDCIESRYQRKIGWMFWEKDWETISAGSYSGIIIPVIQDILSQYSDLSFQQDNAKGHSAAFTKEVLKTIRITPIFWPANWPDLNPIETIWDEMKHYI